MCLCRNKLKDLENLWLLGEEEWGEGVVKEFEIDMYTLLYLKWVISKDLLYSTKERAI